MKRALVAIPLVLALLGLPGGASGLCRSAMAPVHCCCCQNNESTQAGASVKSEGCGCRLTPPPTEDPALPTSTVSLNPGHETASLVPDLGFGLIASTVPTSLPLSPVQGSSPPSSYLSVCLLRC
jgi:hypothetical protein